MALPQGVNFRDSAGYVTDGANEDHEAPGGGGSGATYPHTTAQGNNIGWENTMFSRDRNSGNDSRLAGINRIEGAVDTDFRIDLPSAGNYNIGLAAGDASYARSVSVDLYDTNSSLGTLASGSTSAANRFKDATNTELTNVTWPTSQTLVAKTFATTICRFRLLGISAENPIAHVYVEAGAGGGLGKIIPSRPA